MSKLLKILALVLSAALCISSSAEAQGVPPVIRPTPDSAVVQITLADGSKIVGRITAVTDTEVQVESSFGHTVLRRNSIVSIVEHSTDSLHQGEVWPEDPSRTRLLFAPTGRMLRSGEAYFTDAYILFPGFQLGVSDNFSLGGGASIIPGVNPLDQFYFLTPKLGVYSSPRVNFAVGALVGGAMNINSPVGIAYGVGTYGGEDNSVTAGVGYAFAGTDAKSSALLMIGGSTRLTRNTALVTENYLYTGDGTGIVSGGVRFIGDRISVDLALGANPSSGIPVPYLAFIYKL